MDSRPLCNSDKCFLILLNSKLLHFVTYCGNWAVEFDYVMQVWLAESGHATQLNGLVPSHISQAQKWSTNSWKKFTGVKPTKAELISASSLRKTKYFGGIEEIAKNGSESHIWNWTTICVDVNQRSKENQASTCDLLKLMNNCTVQLLIDAKLSSFLKKQNKAKLFKQYSILRMRKVNIFCIEVRFVRSISYPFFRPWIFSAHLTRGLKEQANTRLRMQFSSPLCRR